MHQLFHFYDNQMDLKHKLYIYTVELAVMYQFDISYITLSKPGYSTCYWNKKNVSIEIINDWYFTIAMLCHISYLKIQTSVKNISKSVK